MNRMFLAFPALFALVSLLIAGACSGSKGSSPAATAQASDSGAPSAGAIPQGQDAGSEPGSADGQSQASASTEPAKPATPNAPAAQGKDTPAAAPPAAAAPAAPAVPSAAPSAPRAQPGQVSLRLNLEKGKKLKYSTETQISVKGAETMGISGDIKQKIEQTVGVKEKTNEGYTLDFTITDVSVAMPESQFKNAIEKRLKDAKGKTWTAKYTTVGRSKDVPGAAESLTNPLGASFASTPAAQGGDAGFLGVSLPEQPVSVGSTWSEEYDIAKLLGNQFPNAKLKKGGKIVITHKAIAIEKKGDKTIVTIYSTTSGDVEFAMTRPERSNSADSQKPAQQEMTFSFTFSGHQTAEVDAATGLPILVTSSNQASTNIGSMAMSQTIKVTTRLVT